MKRDPCMIKDVVILGCTGSIGTSTLKIVSMFPESFRIVGLAAGTNIDALLSIAKDYAVPHIAISNASINFDDLPSCVDTCYSGPNAITQLLQSVKADIVVHGISGTAGLQPSIDALDNGFDLLLANKESIVMGGSLIFEHARKLGRKIIPIDSEHSAVYHLSRMHHKDQIASITLTASGGPFLNTPIEHFSSITPADALRHPTWKMGSKITIDSATLANKGLEVIEAHHLFMIEPSSIDVVIHPQSIIHSLITTTDGYMYAQLSDPDMCLPIANAMFHPDISPLPLQRFDITCKDLSFSEPDLIRFPMLALAYDALIHGGAYPLAYNTANELAVYRFLSGASSFTSIWERTQDILSLDWSKNPGSLKEVLEIDEEVRMVFGKGGLS